MLVSIAREYYKVYWDYVDVLYAKFSKNAEDFLIQAPEKQRGFYNVYDIIVSFTELPIGIISANTIIQESDEQSKTGILFLSEEVLKMPVEKQKVILVNELLNILVAFVNTDIGKRLIDEFDDLINPFKDDLDAFYNSLLFPNTWKSKAPKYQERLLAIREILVPPIFLVEILKKDAHCSIADLRKDPKGSDRIIRKVAQKYSHSRKVEVQLVYTYFLELVNMNEKDKILSLDGGGIRGIVQVRALEHIFGNTTIKDRFDVITGTSAGAIIAAAISLNIKLGDITELFHKIGNRLFSYRLGTKDGGFFQKVLFYLTFPLGFKLVRDAIGFVFAHLAIPKYSSRKLKRLIINSVKGIDKINFGDCKPRLIIYAVNLKTYKIEVFDSYSSKYKDLKLIDVVMASSSAPTYFAPYKIKDMKTTFVDGGLACNNPSIATIRELWEQGFNRDAIKVLSIPNDSHINNKALFWPKPVFIWAKKIIDIFFETSDELSNKFSSSVLPDPKDFYRLEVPLDGEVKLDDGREKTIKKLLDAAYQAVDDQQDNVDVWLSF